MTPLIAGTHKQLDPIQKPDVRCIVCDKPIYVSGYGLDAAGKVRRMDYDRGIGLECLANMMKVYGGMIKRFGPDHSSPEEQEELKNLEVSNQEYLEEMQRLTPIIKNNPRLAYLMGWMNEAGKLDIEESPMGIMKQFQKDMDEIAGAV